MVIPVAGPLGTVGVERLSKLATTFFGPLIGREVGLVVLDKSPDQFRKL